MFYIFYGDKFIEANAETLTKYFQLRSIKAKYQLKGNFYNKINLPDVTDISR